MTGKIGIVLLAFVAHAHAKEVVANRSANAYDSMDRLVQKFFTRALSVAPLHQQHSAVNNATLGKPGNLAVGSAPSHILAPSYHTHPFNAPQAFPNHGLTTHRLPPLARNGGSSIRKSLPKRLQTVALAEMPDTATPHAKLIFCRHGISDWNIEGKFTGWVDVDLADKGVNEAKEGGKLLKEGGYHVDICYTSYLKRAIKTGNIVLEELDQLSIPVEKTWRLNERMYGGLTGLDKKETVKKYGPEQVQIWRRSYDIPPPLLDKGDQYHPLQEAKYKDVDPKDLPDTECLKDTIERVMPYWDATITPQLKAGKNVLVAAHGNSIRAIVKFMEGMSDDVIPGLEIPTGVPLVYHLDADLKPMPSAMAVEPLKYGFYLGDPEKIAAAAQAVKDQTKVAK